MKKRIAASGLDLFFDGPFAWQQTRRRDI